MYSKEERSSKGGHYFMQKLYICVCVCVCVIVVLFLFSHSVMSDSLQPLGL